MSWPQPKWIWYIEAIVAWSIPGMSGRSLGSGRQGQDLARSISGDLDVNWGPAMCGEDKQQEPVSTNVETKRERGENLKCVPAVGTSASALLLPWPQNLWLHVTHTALPDIPYFYKSNIRLLCVFLASSDSSQVQTYPIWYFLAAWGNSLT